MEMEWWLAELRSACQNNMWMRVWHLYHRWPFVEVDYDADYVLGYVSSYLKTHPQSLITFQSSKDFCKSFEHFLQTRTLENSTGEDHDVFGYASGETNRDARYHFERLSDWSSRSTQHIPGDISVCVGVEGTRRWDKHEETLLKWEFVGSCRPMFLAVNTEDLEDARHNRRNRPVDFSTIANSSMVNLHPRNSVMVSLRDATDSSVNFSFEGSYERQALKDLLQASLNNLQAVEENQPLSVSLPHDPQDFISKYGLPYECFREVEARYFAALEVDPLTIWPEAFRR